MRAFSSLSSFSPIRVSRSVKLFCLKGLVPLPGAILLAILAASLLSCHHQELCEHHPHSGIVRVVFDWENAPEVNPPHMQVWFYPTDGSRHTPFQLVGRDGGVVNIPAGEYNIICLDGSHENIAYKDQELFHGFEIYTRPTTLLAPMQRASSNVPVANGTEEQPVITEPDPVYGHSLANVMIEDNVPVTITMYPQPLTCTYEVVIHNVENLARAEQLSASMSGLAPSLHVSTAGLRGEPSIMPFSVTRVDDTTVSGKFLAFGHWPTDEMKHPVVIYAVMEDGAQRYQIFDDEDGSISMQIDTSPDPHYVKIELEDLNLPETSSGGMGVDVSDWGSEVFDITL